MPARRILIAESDAVLARSLSEQILAQEDVAALETAADAVQALAAARRTRFDAAIVDAALPGAADFCLTLRAEGRNWPVLALGAEAPAPGCETLAKPFRIAVLLARLRAMIRAFENSDEAVLTIGPYTFEPLSKQLVTEDPPRRIRLTEKEAAILKYLYRQGSAPVGREILLHEVWGYNPAVTTHTLETHVYRLRRKIEKNPAAAEILVTEAGGYRLVP